MKAQKKDSFCPECGNHLICDTTRGEISCSSCGLVISMKSIDLGPEWRAFHKDEKLKKARVGPPCSLILFNKGLGTEINISDRDAYGKNINPTVKSSIYRIKKWNQRTWFNTSKERNLKEALSYLELFCSKLELSRNIKESAAHLYRKMSNKELTKGRRIEAMIIAAIYLICRFRGFPKKLEDFLSFTDLNEKIIAKYYHLIVQKLNFKLMFFPPMNYLGRYCSELNLSEKTQRIATLIIKEIKKQPSAIGKAPSSISAMALYIAGLQTGERRTQKQISAVVGTTEATIRKRYREFIHVLEFKKN